MNENKPRTTTISGTTASETTELSVSIDPHTGQIRFGPDMVNTRVETSYPRPKGPKTIHEIPVDPSALNVDPNQALGDNFDLLFAVDTNTRRVKGLKISVTGVIEAEHAFDPKNGSLALAFRTAFLLQFTQVISRPENLGWMVAIQNIEATAEYFPFARIGIIVDSDYANIRKFNQRRLPIFENWFLPKRFTLVYASADVGSEYLANKFLWSADTASRRMFNLLETGKAALNGTRIENAPFATFKKIVPARPARVH